MVPGLDFTDYKNLKPNFPKEKRSKMTSSSPNFEKWFNLQKKKLKGICKQGR